MTAVVLVLLSLVSATGPESSYVESDATSKVLDLDPDMKNMLATDTVSQFNPSCFEDKCGHVLKDTFNSHSSFKDTWKCLTTDRQGDCIRDKKWGDFPAYEMHVFDCGHHQGCIDFDLSSFHQQGEDDDESSLLQEGEIDYNDLDYQRALEQLKESSFMEEDEEDEEEMDDDEADNTIGDLKKKLSDPKFLGTLTDDQVASLHDVLKEQMQKVAVLNAVLLTFEEHKPKEKEAKNSMIEEGVGGTDQAFLDWYHDVQLKLSKMTDITEMSPQSLMQQIADATQIVAQAMEDSHGNEEKFHDEMKTDLESSLHQDMTSQTSRVGEIRKPTMQSMSVSADGNVHQEKNLRNEK